CFVEKQQSRKTSLTPRENIFRINFRNKTGSENIFQRPSQNCAKPNDGRTWLKSECWWGVMPNVTCIAFVTPN
ncbi:MAG TPA: hypothetical protein VET23_06915, partial [Chitinophagaceae bacterium]|nr:hypothetical protein [Chitinophagaceae bacterium]